MTWQKVVELADCRPCEDCGEPVCEHCQLHYVECGCPGPSQDDLFEYREDRQGIVWARKL